MRERLEQLGLRVSDGAAGMEAVLALRQQTLLNPLTRREVEEVTFSVAGELLVPIQPPELVGIAPISIPRLTSTADLEAQVHAAFNENVLQLQRRSGQLQAMGIASRVEPGTMQLTAELEGSGHEFLIALDRRGGFRVLKARRDGAEVDVSAGHTFDLNEFRERAGLIGYLVALFGGEVHEDHAPPRGAAAELENLISHAEIAERFGRGALVPPHSPVDVLMVLEAGGQAYRFAAARVVGRTFRGLLAGASGKLWAERFDLDDDFPGPRKLLADLLQLPESEVKVVAEEAP
ncbi:MAG TPA: hypothetical protein VFA20_16125 [Myxococcaceae bacterium]|nr:hypothetical protein [Myxococcaceae bacterium]